VTGGFDRKVEPAADEIPSPRTEECDQPSRSDCFQQVGVGEFPEIKSRHSVSRQQSPFPNESAHNLSTSRATLRRAPTVFPGSGYVVGETQGLFKMQTYTNRMSAAERLDEIADILAAGLIRLSARKSSALSRDRGESSLDFSPDQSGHAVVLDSVGNAR
jgi:hypothetical protein